MAARMASALVATLLVLGSAEQVTPVQKVLQMMEEMKTKSLADKADEVVNFKGFMQFCKDTSAAKEKAVSDAADQIEKLHADIEKYNADVKTLGKEISKLDRSTNEAQADKAKSTAEYEEEQADYQKTHAEYELNIEDLAVGVSQLKSMMSATNAASFIQKLATKKTMPASARKVLSAFLATSSSSELSAPEGAKYESQSGGIVEMLEGLGTKMEEEKRELEQENLKAQGAYQVVQQTLVDQIDQHTAMRNHKASTKKDKEAASSQASGDVASTETAKASDEAFLKDLYAECTIKSSDFEAKQKLRSGEVTALNKAIEIISGGAVSGAADKHLPTMVQTSVLAQLRSVADSQKKPSQTAVASFLQAQGKRLNSRVLAAIALRAQADPFGKVKKMIQDMVYKLMEEANQEAEHKGFCDTEMGTNKQTRDQKSSMVDQLTASIEEMSSTISQLGEEIAELEGQIAESNEAVSTATSLRTAEKAKNEQTIADAAGASAAVKQALKVLQAFYESAGASLVQRSVAHGHHKSPVQSGAATGIVGMLEVILSDFERLLADTKSSEETSQSEYETFMNDSSKEKAVMEAHVKNKSESRTETDVALAEAKKDLKSTQEELAAAEAYFEKLKPSCVEAVVSYDDRVERRKEEIESLSEALKILNDSM